MSTSPVKRVQGQPRAQNSPSPGPDPASPRVLNTGSPFGMTLRGCLSAGASILRASECLNKGINILARTVLPGTKFLDVQLELGCTTMGFVHLGSKTGPEIPVIEPAPRPMGFQTALASIFGDEKVNTVDAQALAELAAMASSYQPSPEIQTTVQIPDSQTAGDTVMENTPAPASQELIPFMPESSVPELPMDMGNGQNTEKTGLGIANTPTQIPPHPTSARFPTRRYHTRHYWNPSHPQPGLHPPGQALPHRSDKERQPAAFASCLHWPGSGHQRRSWTPSQKPVAASRQTPKRNR